MPSRSTFPKRVYTIKEVKKARKLVKSGYKHRLLIKGSPTFKRKTKEALEHIKTAQLYDFLRSYIHWIIEIDGFSQLRETEAAIWANIHLLENPIEAAGFIIQKAYLMKEFLEGKLYFGGAAEARSIDQRIQFLTTLEKRSEDAKTKRKCKKLLDKWAESTSSVGP